MKYVVAVLDEVRTEDIPDLSAGARPAAAKLVAQLYEDPRIGESMRERFNLAILSDCRKVSFDEEGWTGKPRFRLVFRNEPDDGAVARTTVLAIAAREKLDAYRRAATRRGRQRRSGSE
ncbi:MAG: hypothetical protein ACR2KV_11965 [Solirubrobacteraceae bacterium]